MTGTQALLISGQISLPVSVSAVAAAAGIKVIDYAAFRAQFENSLDDICRMVSYAGFSMLADGRMVAVLNSQLCYAPRRKWTAAHEVGHLLSGHITDPPTLLTQRQEREADDFAAELLAPQGYDTVITEDGGSLSQGQKQLLCITRVMLCLPPMLILDEATSSIDTRTEIKIQDSFAKMMNGRTSFIVAHRLSTIREADVILVMKDGHIIEQGNHEELLAKNGFYANLYNSQFAV